MSVLGKLSDYEIARLKRIQEIQRAMEEFGVKQASDEVKEKKRKTTSMKRSAATWKKKKPRVIRRSRRTSKKPVLYEASDLDDALEKRTVNNKARKRTIRKPIKVPELSADQRKRLAKAEHWLEEMESFLLNVPHGRNGKVISEANCRTVMRQVRVLVSGKGIYYKHWDEGVACFKDQAITLATDFVELWEKAREFEHTHGRDRGIAFEIAHQIISRSKIKFSYFELEHTGNGWLLLHPITKLLCFQIYKVGQIGVCDSADSESRNGKDDSEEERHEENSEEEMQKQWLRYVTTEDNETLRTISHMEDAPSLKELLKNNRAQFPEIKADSRLKIGTSVWIRQALDSESEDDEDEQKKASKRRRVVRSASSSSLSPPPPPPSPKNKIIGRSVKKVFEGYGTFKGTVKDYNKARRVYMVEYEDGDSEEMSVQLLKKILL